MFRSTFSFILLNMLQNNEKKLRLVLKWPVAVRRRIDHLEKTYGRNVYFSQAEYDDAKRNHDDVDILKRTRCWEIMLKKDCPEMNALRNSLTTANIDPIHFCSKIAVIYYDISKYIVHALDQMGADDVPSDGIVHFTQFENRVIEHLMAI